MHGQQNIKKKIQTIGFRYPKSFTPNVYFSLLMAEISTLKYNCKNTPFCILVVPPDDG